MDGLHSLLDSEDVGPEWKAQLEKQLKILIVDKRDLADDVRVKVWATLLEVPETQDDDMDEQCISAMPLDSPKQRTIKMDAQRTRGEIAYFRQDGQTERIERLLSYYCTAGYACQGDPLGARKLPPISYRQGLNEILAVFMYLGYTTDGLRDGRIMAMFSKFVARFAPRVYATNDDDFLSLQCSFRLFRLLLLFHDPDLCKLLDQYDVVPELYATPWFLTLFSRGQKMEVVLKLWDFLLACVRSPGPFLFHCIALSFLIHHRKTIIEAANSDMDPAELPLVVSRLEISTLADVDSIIDTSIRILVNTPLYFRRQVHNVYYSGRAKLHDIFLHGSRGPPPVSAVLLTRLEKRICLKISVQEILAGAPSRLTPHADGEGHFDAPDCVHELPTRSLLLNAEKLAGRPRYFLIDCRPRSEYEDGGHMPTAFHFDPCLLDEPDELEELFAGLESLKGLHIAVMGSGDPTQWYHTPAVPAHLKHEAATSMGSQPAPSELYAESGVCVDDDSADGAVHAGLDPLLAEEDADYCEGDITRALILLLIQRGFAHVCEVEGGYAAIHQHQSFNLSTTLVNHNSEFCRVCSSTTPHVRSRATSSASERAGAGLKSPHDDAWKASISPTEVPSIRRRLHAIGAWLAGATDQPREASPIPFSVHEHGDEVEIVLFGQAEDSTPVESPVAPPRRSKTVRKQSSRSVPIVADVDVDGLPIFTEDAYLEMQCDDLERKHSTSTGGEDSRPPTSPHNNHRIANGRRLTEPPRAGDSTAVYNVDEVVAAKAVSAAKNAAKLAKSVFKTVLAAPSPSHKTSAPTTSDKAASLPSQEGGEGLSPAKQRTLPPPAAESKITARTTRFLDALRYKERSNTEG